MQTMISGPLVSKTFSDRDMAVAKAIQLALSNIPFTLDAATTIEVREADAAALNGVRLDGFVLWQEGGSSSEMYLHAHETLKDAENDRISCADDGSYRTSTIVRIPAALAAMGELFYEAVEKLQNATNQLAYGEEPDVTLETPPAS